jgi:hypothetical protein
MMAICVFSGRAALAQCENKAGFARQACEVETGNVAALGSDALRLNQPGGAALTTGFADSFHAATMAPALQPASFTPLTELDRVDDGAFILKPGSFEATLETFLLDAGQPAFRRGEAFYPAPLKGQRAKIVGSLLKQAELHPELPHSAMQQLMTAVVLGAQLERMPLLLQQTAARLLPPEMLKQLSGATGTQAAARRMLMTLNNRLRSNGTIGRAMNAASGRFRGIDQAYGITDTATALGIGRRGRQASSIPPSNPAAFVQMPGGFYVRYLPDQMASVRIQVVVPSPATASAAAKAPLTFDPTQYLAISAGVPRQRLGATLRKVR